LEDNHLLVLRVVLSRLLFEKVYAGFAQSDGYLLPRGSFVYFVFSFIDCLSSTPITGATDPDHVLTVNKPYSHDTVPGFSKTVIPLLRFTMLKVFRDNAVRVRKSQLASSNATPCFDWFGRFFV
jgi:hypothetical protein